MPWEKESEQVLLQSTCRTPPTREEECRRKLPSLHSYCADLLSAQGGDFRTWGLGGRLHVCLGRRCQTYQKLLSMEQILDHENTGVADVQHHAVMMTFYAFILFGFSEK